MNEDSKSFHVEDGTLTVFYHGKNWDQAINEALKELKRDFKMIIAIPKEMGKI
jgi:thiamine phosphate synthase YjbQ (UPF0047 family)